MGLVKSDTIGVSWNAEAVQRAGVKNINLVAVPYDDAHVIVKKKTSAANGQASFSGDLQPSSTYHIYVEDAGNGDFVYVIGEIKTLSLGEHCLIISFLRSYKPSFTSSCFLFYPIKITICAEQK